MSIIYDSFVYHCGHTCSLGIQGVSVATTVKLTDYFHEKFGMFGSEGAHSMKYWIFSKIFIHLINDYSFLAGLG